MLKKSLHTRAHTADSTPHWQPLQRHRAPANPPINQLINQQTKLHTCTAVGWASRRRRRRLLLRLSCLGSLLLSSEQQAKQTSWELELWMDANGAPKMWCGVAMSCLVSPPKIYFLCH